MKRYLILVICVGLAMGIAMPVLAQQKSEGDRDHSGARERTGGRCRSAMDEGRSRQENRGPDSMGELWTDDFFDVLPGGKVVGKQEMMDMMVKSERKPGTEPSRHLQDSRRLRKR